MLNKIFGLSLQLDGYCARRTSANVCDNEM